VVKKSKNRTLLVVLSALAIALFSACDKSAIYNSSEVLNDGKWVETDTLFAEFEVTDSLHYHSVLLLARFNSLYPYSNIYFKVHLAGPKGQRMTEIKSYDITDKSGKWLGKGFSDLHSYELPLFSDLPLKLFGTYKVKVIPYMRKDVINGVHDRGIKVNLGQEIF
jgi:gliding motility-associated lipoprotein GldH